MALRRLLIKAFASIEVTGGARITAADFRLRLLHGDHRLRENTAVSPGSDAHRRHHPGGVGTINGVAFCVSRMRAAAGRSR